jgi:hypothetical protein
MSTASKIFDFHFNNEKVALIQFNPAWNNGTGYFDFAVKGEFAPVLKAGQLVKAVAHDGRKIIIIGTPLGSVAVFQRYIPSTTTTMPIVYNTTSAVGSARLIPHGAMTHDTAVMVLGDESVVMPDNIGFMLERIIEASKNINPVVETMEVGNFKLTTWEGVDGGALLTVTETERSFPVRIVGNMLVINADSIHVKGRIDGTVNVLLE